MLLPPSLKEMIDIAHPVRAVNCHGCPLRAVCHNRNGNRTIEVNHRLRKSIQKARERLLSEEGIKHRKQRPANVEHVFGNKEKYQSSHKRP
jgi:hypothetical protein